MTEPFSRAHVKVGGDVNFNHFEREAEAVALKERSPIGLFSGKIRL